jgi:energy-coupling factor transporter ATP-binding protein EcfA2
MSLTFAKAVKYESKGRIALIGPAGSGKSYTMLTMARLLAGPKGKIAAIDTEQGSLSKYADLFEFDVAPLKSFTADRFLDALKAAELGGYSVFCCDSLSHFWMGKDGALEFVDAAAKHSSSRDSMSGWKEFRPIERQMVDAMIASPIHVICTMRTKTAYEEQVNERTGKKQRVKIGLAPVQREGLEYEFDLVGLMDEDNTFIVDKTRCPALSGKALTKPRDEDFIVFRDWLSGVRPVEVERPKVRLVPDPAPAPAPEPTVSKLNGNILRCVVTDLLEKKTAGGKPYISITLKEPISGKRFAACWHVSLFDALRKTPGEECQFEIAVTEKFLNIENILAIGEQEYRDGKPYNESPVMAGLGITDDDIPF